jgi:release factor glutamine methyltransferase
MQSLLEEITKHLEPLSGTPALDASVLIARIIGKPRAYVLAHLELTLTTDQQTQLADALARLKRGELFPYVIGAWEFFGRSFIVTPDALIPRPETELLIEKAIAWLKAHPNRRNVIDVGTGSGCIAVSIALEIPDANIIATDISSAALSVARSNVERYHVEDRVKLIECDLFPFNFQPATFNLILSNPPYVPTSTLTGLSVYGREPTQALDGGADGLGTIRRLLALGSGVLDRGGMILFEIESTLGAETIQLSKTYFQNAKISLMKDLIGLDRLIAIET